VLMDRVSDPQGGREAFTWMSTAVAGGTASSPRPGPRRNVGVSAALLLPLLAVAASLAAIALSRALRRRAPLIWGEVCRAGSGERGRCS